MSLHRLISHSNSPLAPPGPGAGPSGFIALGGPGVPGSPGSRIPVRQTSIFSRVRQLFSSRAVPLGGPSAQQLRRQLPQVSIFTPQPTQQYHIGVIPPVVPSSPSSLRNEGASIISPDLGSVRGSITMPPQQEHQSSVHASDDELYTPLEQPHPTMIPGIESTRSPSPVAPAVAPDPQIALQQPPTSMFVHTPPQPLPSQLGRTSSPPHSRSPTPPPIPGQWPTDNYHPPAA